MSYEPMRVLIYKRTHAHDPNKKGVFGIYDCMGRMRDYDYDAVIGIGIKHPDDGYEDIACKINWIGIKPTPQQKYCRANLITFAKFCLYNGEGELVEKIAPALYKYMYEEKKRTKATCIKNNR